MRQKNQQPNAYLSGVNGHLEHLRGGRSHGVFQHAALVRRVVQVLVDGVRRLSKRGEIAVRNKRDETKRTKKTFPGTRARDGGISSRAYVRRGKCSSDSTCTVDVKLEINRSVHAALPHTPRGRRFTKCASPCPENERITHFKTTTERNTTQHTGSCGRLPST